jgi:hypothetical protein
MDTVNNDKHRAVLNSRVDDLKPLGGAAVSNLLRGEIRRQVEVRVSALIEGVSNCAANKVELGWEKRLF